MMMQFPGSYRLVSMTRRDETGRVRDLQSPITTGRTGYDRGGRMWVLLVPASRRASPDVDNDTAGDDRAALNGVVAYYGSYTVDPNAATVVHRVEAAIDPTWIGRTFVRQYAFSGDLLTLSFDNGPIRIRTVYQRLPDIHAAAVGEDVGHESHDWTV
jgi:hypothetical protein